MPTKPPKLSDQLPEHLERYDYRSKDGVLTNVVLRMDGDPKFLPFSPKGDKWACKWEKPTTLYRLPELLAADKDAQIVVVEGERCADTYHKHLPEETVTTWPFGPKNWSGADWSPLFGRKVLLYADADEEGRNCMDGLARHLQANECEVSAVMPAKNTGRDVHDWLEKGGPGLLDKAIQTCLITYRKEKNAPEPTEAPIDVVSNEFYDVLGNLDTAVAVMLHTRVMVTHSRASLAQLTVLTSLAPDWWWYQKMNGPEMDRRRCLRAQSAILAEADRLGQVDLGKVLGRGFFRLEDGRAACHMGDRVFVGGKGVDLAEVPGATMLVSRPPIRASAEPATPEQRKQFAEAMLRYRWKTPQDGMKFLGWLVCSVIGGLLEWRPHCWLVAPAETGKTWIMGIAKQVLGEFYIDSDDTTPAGLARMVGGDSLPVLIDEAEPIGQDLDGLMNMLRVATSKHGKRTRAEAGSSRSVQIQVLRFSAMLSSTQISEMSKANESRFAKIQLSETGVPDWREALRAIQQSVGDGKAQRILAGIVADADRIATRAKHISNELVGSGAGRSTRACMISGALSAGWQWMAGDEQIAEMDITAGEAEDAGELLRFICTLQVRWGTDEAPLIFLAADTGPNNSNNTRLAERYGIKIDRFLGKPDKDMLWIAPSHPNLRSRISRSKWERVNLRELLLQLGAKPGNQRHFDSTRFYAVGLSRKLCAAHGVELDRFVGDQESEPDEGEEDEIPF